MLAAALSPGCGARTGLQSTAAIAEGSAGDAAGGGGGEGGEGGVDGGTAPPDRCPSAVSGPKPMAGNCSTRDGRSRVRAPASPHVTWSRVLPTGTPGSGISSLASDASGTVFVVTTGDPEETAAALRRVRASDGTVLWSDPIKPDQETQTPIVLARGGVDLFGYTASYADALYTYEAASGASSSTTFGFDLYYAPADPAVGQDGSLYLVHEDNVGSYNTHAFLSRVDPGGHVLWSSPELVTLFGANPTGDISPARVALAQGDRVVLSFDLESAGALQEVVLGLDPRDGHILWRTELGDQVVGGPAVRPAGDVAFVLNHDGASQIALLDPADGKYAASPIATGAFDILAVAENGVVIVDGASGSGVSGVSAVRSDGSVLWTHDLVNHATVAAGGVVVAFGPSIVALDVDSGSTLWELAPPSGSCIFDVALTSDGELVGIQCDGTLFGASD